MARLHVMERSHAQAVMDDLHDALGRRLAVSSLAPCPVEFTAALVNLCSTQSCGKCTPCRVGLSALSDLLADVLEGRADESTLNLIERTARTIYLSSDCAIGYEAGAMALTAIRGFRDDFEHHIREHSCGFDREARVPCVSGCPAHVDIPGYISLVEAGRYADAVKVIRKNNPLPLVCGLVCEHPCEMHCRRGMVDDPMNILALKRFAVEHSDLNDYKPRVADNTGKRIAVVGGGRAGLSCAYYLAEKGYRPTVFEKEKQPGGMLMHGIPEFRLEKDVIEAEINVLRALGVEFHCGVEVGRDVTIPELREQGYKGFYVAIGLQSGGKLGVPGEDAEGVKAGIELMREVNLEGKKSLSGRVVVIGGGNIGADVARTALRCGAEKVSLYCLEDYDSMPMGVEDRTECEEDGIEIHAGWGQTEILAENGKCSGIRFRKCLSVRNAEGRFAPTFDDNTTEEVPCDMVLYCIGQKVDWKGLLTGTAVELNPNGTAKADPVTYQTAEPDIFVGGDVYTGQKFAIDAIAAGKQGAVSLHRWVQDATLTIGRDKREFIELDKNNLLLEEASYDNTPRQRIGYNETLRKTFKDGRVAFTEEQVKAETARCLGCGASVVDPNKCIGCGICTTRCAFDAIHLHRDLPECSTMRSAEDKMKGILPYMIKRKIRIRRAKKAEKRNG